MPRIVVDARTVTDRKSGIGNTLDALVRHMVPLAGDIELVLLRQSAADAPIVRDERVTETVYAGETKSPRTLFVDFPRGFQNADLYHSPADVVPLRLRCPMVVTLHDLMWIEAPRLASAFMPVRIGNGAWYRATIGYSVRHARRIIAISEATREAIRRVYPRHAAKVRVVHHGLELERYAPERGGPRSLLDAVVPHDVHFSLIVGQGSPYKNHPAMIRAFVEAMRDRDDHRLVLVRRFHRVDAEMEALLRRPDVKRLVIAVPHVSDETLFALYRHARMLLFASLYEGFGLPALEAMAFGVPVLGSTAAAVREVVGDAALLADPKSHGDLVTKIRQLDRDEPLRARLIEAGGRRVRDFSWDRAARQTLAVYREALEG